MKNKKYYYVVSEGLNKFGAEELNKFYQFNIEAGYIRKDLFVEGWVPCRNTKRYRQINKFGPDTSWGTIDAKQERFDKNGNEIQGYDRTASYFTVELKHMNYKVYEVNETYTEIKL